MKTECEFEVTKPEDSGLWKITRKNKRLVPRDLHGEFTTKGEGERFLQRKLREKMNATKSNSSKD